MMNNFPACVSDKIFVFLISITVLASQGCSQRPGPSENNPSAKRPNILIILADDMGYSDLGCYGSEIETPNLDSIAMHGLRFRHFYNAARCCPTRAALLTGLYPHEAGMGRMVSPLDRSRPLGPNQGFLTDSSVTIAEVLKKSGYATYMSGKWHVGERPEHWPRKRGFDRYFGLISGGSSYFELLKNDSRIRQMALDDQPWMPTPGKFYMTDAFSDYAVSFLQEHFTEKAGSPFLLYLAYTAPHWPLHALPEEIEKYKGKYAMGWDSLRMLRYQNMMALGIIDSTYHLSPREEGVSAWENVENKNDWSIRMAVYAAMIDRMDQGIGKVFETLKQNEAWDNTLIFFLSDNGASNEDISKRKLHDPAARIGYPGSYVAYKKPWAIASNTPFRRYKKWVNEGGIATPFIVHWPDVITSPGVVSDYAHVIDLMATCIDVAGAEYPADHEGTFVKPLQGKSIKPLFTGGHIDPQRPLYWEHLGHQAMRKGKWKIVADPPEFQWRLYDMEKDPTEMQDVSTDFRNVVESLVADYQKWADRVGVSATR